MLMLAVILETVFETIVVNTHVYVYRSAINTKRKSNPIHVRQGAQLPDYWRNRDSNLDTTRASWKPIARANALLGGFLPRNGLSSR